MRREQSLIGSSPIPSAKVRNSNFRHKNVSEFPQKPRQMFLGRFGCYPYAMGSNRSSNPPHAGLMAFLCGTFHNIREKENREQIISSAWQKMV